MLVNRRGLDVLVSHDIPHGKHVSGCQIRMKVDARTVQAFDLRQVNVIDIDCYGEPWAIWGAIRERISKPSAVFLTFGHVQTTACAISEHLRTQCGIPAPWLIPTNTVLYRILGRRYLLSSLSGLPVKKALCAERRNVSYYGFLIVT